MVPTPEQLWSWSNKKARAAEKTDQGTVYPTVREAARRFNCKMEEIEQVADGHIEDKYLGLASYYTAPPEPLADHIVEAYGDE